MSDPLTGAGSAVRLREDLEALWGRVQRYGHAYCLAAFGIEGGPVAEGVIRAVGEALEHAIRVGDALYRYDAERFAVLLPEQALDTGTQAAERLRREVKRPGLVHPGGAPVVLSAGVVTSAGAQGGAEDLLARALAALERAVQAGGDRVEGHSDTPSALRLLVADDDAATRGTLGALVRGEAGLDLVGEAKDAAQAVELARRRRPDVVLLDVDMPGGRGIRAAVDIREALPDVRIVAISADASQANQYETMRAGAVGFLTKGAPDEEILRVIRSSARW